MRMVVYSLMHIFLIVFDSQREATEGAYAISESATFRIIVRTGILNNSVAERGDGIVPG